MWVKANSTWKNQANSSGQTSSLLSQHQSFVPTTAYGNEDIMPAFLAHTQSLPWHFCNVFTTQLVGQLALLAKWHSADSDAMLYARLPLQKGSGSGQGLPTERRVLLASKVGSILDLPPSSE